MIPVLFFKGGKSGTPGLLLRTVTDKHGHAVKRWTRSGDSAPATRAQRPLADAERQYRDAERAYGGRPAYDQAKAAGKTKLTYGQWVQVRTPNFLQWFGRWDAAESATMNRMVGTFDDAKIEAKKIVGQPLTNLSTGLVSVVSNGNLSKMLSASAALKSSDAAVHALAVANVDRLFTHALLDHSHADRHGEPTIAAVHRYVAPMRMPDGRILAVKLTVKETTGPNEPNPLYSVESIVVQKPALDAPETGIERGIGRNRQPPQAGFASIVNDALTAVNGDGVSKVIDAHTGEPLVLYHGTGGDFEAFSRKLAGATTRAANAGLGFFLTDTPDIAARYAEATTDGAQNIIPAFVSLRNPLRLTAKHMLEADRMLMNNLKAEHDGAIIAVARPDGSTQTVVMARHARQVKSAIGNNGNFSRRDKRLTKAVPILFLRERSHHANL